jgi:hypothetical protein
MQCVILICTAFPITINLMFYYNKHRKCVIYTNGCMKFELGLRLQRRHLNYFLRF